MESSRDARVWHWGPPAHIGWWNASSSRNRDTWRWWDGTAWGMPCSSVTPAANAALSAARHDGPMHQPVILWNDYWPEGARVPRVAPAQVWDGKPWSDRYNLVS